jgi:ABC-type lipoprotein export system ATPase subunit
LPLINHISALENVIQPLLIGGQNWAVAEKKGKQILAELELGHRYRDEVFTFSDSEYSKLLLARALIHEPDLILIDDSLEHLGPEARQLINQLLKTRLEQGATIIDSVKPTMTLPPHTHRVIELMDARVTDDTEQLYVDISL